LTISEQVTVSPFPHLLGSLCAKFEVTNYRAAINRQRCSGFYSYLRVSYVVEVKEQKIQHELEE